MALLGRLCTARSLRHPLATLILPVRTEASCHCVSSCRMWWVREVVPLTARVVTIGTARRGALRDGSAAGRLERVEVRCEGRKITGRRTLHTRQGRVGSSL